MIDAQQSSSPLVRWTLGGRYDRALLCIPWAGAGAAPFRTWVPVVGDVAAVYGVRAAGRETRFREDLPGTLGAVVEELVAAIGALSEERVVLFGHCSGAIAAFEVARALRNGASTRRVERLVVVGQMAPRLLDAPSPPEEHDLERYVPEPLQTEPELVEHLLRAIAADMRLVTRYQYVEAEPLDVPLTAIRGGRDEALTDADVSRWCDETSAATTCTTVPDADHLFSGDAWLALAQEVRSAIA